MRHRYEGVGVLSELLEAAGCELSVEEVRFEFEASLEEDRETPPGDVIPLLFEREPRFSDSEAAKRLYANLLGLWDRVKTGADAGPLRVLHDEVEPAPEEPEPVEGKEVPPAHVGWVYGTLYEGSDRDRQGAEDRLENVQPDLVTWVRDALADCEPQAEELAVGLCVVAHESFRLAFGARLGQVPFAWLREEAGGAAEAQPALAGFMEDALDEAAEAEAEEEDEDPLSPADRERVSRVLARVRLALTRAVH